MLRVQVLKVHKSLLLKLGVCLEVVMLSSISPSMADIQLLLTALLLPECGKEREPNGVY